jgi:hypothetical protein
MGLISRCPKLVCIGFADLRGAGASQGGEPAGKELLFVRTKL